MRKKHRNLQELFKIAKPWQFIVCCLLFFSAAVPFTSAASNKYFEEKTKECNKESKKDDVRCLEFLAGMAILNTYDRKEGRKKAEQLYKRALLIKPDDLSVLDSLARLYARQKRYQEALDLSNRYIAIQPSNLEAAMYRCMLWERMRYPKYNYMNCYKKILQGYRDRKETNGLNYVFAMMMADEPGAEKLKHAYIDSLKPGSSDRELWEDLLRNADRKKLLDEIIP